MEDGSKLSASWMKERSEPTFVGMREQSILTELFDVRFSSSLISRVVSSPASLTFLPARDFPEFLPSITCLLIRLRVSESTLSMVVDTMNGSATDRRILR